MISRQILIVLAAMASLLQAEKPLPDPQTLVAAALENQNVFANKRSDYVCTYTNHILDGSHRERLYEVLFINGYEIRRLVAENGKLLPPDRAAEEATRLNLVIAEAEKRPPPPFTVMDGVDLHYCPSLLLADGRRSHHAFLQVRS